MGVLPDTHNELIQFFEQRIADWAANAAAIGLTTEQVAALTPLITAARASYDAAQAARIASKGATEAANTDRSSLRSAGGDAINTIKAFAEASDDPSVYITAQVPAPKTPEPLGPPATPRNLGHTISDQGAILITWDGSRAGGTVWVVERALSNAAPPGTFGDYAYLGTVIERSFTDPEVPAGTAIAQYRIRALRAGGQSSWSVGYPVVLGAASGPQAGGGDNAGNDGLSLAA